MQRDAQNITDGTALDADICIIGGGPAGISLVQEFISHSAKIVWLESGGLKAEQGAQRLNAGLVVGTAYAGLQQTRHRQTGGTACIWNTPLNGDVGAKYVPLETCDFEPRTDSDYVGWPFELNHLQSFYARAQSVCGLGQYNYSGKQSHRLKTSFPLPDAQVRHSVFQFGPASIFTDNHLRAINSSDNIELLYHATACAIKIQSQGHSMATIEAGTLAGNRFRIKSGIVVLAAGAIENARLLLASREPGQDAPGDKYGWVGRCFMEHPRDYSMSVTANRHDVYSRAAFYDRHTADDGTTIAGRIAVDPESVIRDGLPNASLTFLPLVRRASSRKRLLARVVDRVTRYKERKNPGGYGWSQNPNPDAAFDGFRLLLNTEQWPHPENRVILGRRSDRFGVPKPEVRWQWRPEDQRKLEQVRTLFATELQAAGIGQIEIQSDVNPDPNAHHHAGTTRMHNNPRLGVVNPDGLVHGTDNVYVAGASVFPTAGFANPTLTIVALALRLADQLKQRL